MPKFLHLSGIKPVSTEVVSVTNSLKSIPKFNLQYTYEVNFMSEKRPKPTPRPKPIKTVNGLLGEMNTSNNNNQDKKQAP